MRWGSVREDEHGKWQLLLRSDGELVGSVEQFPGNAPTTYAWALGKRIGALESWDAALDAVERRLPKIVKP